MLSDRLAPPAPKEIQDPLVQSVTVEPQQIRIQLAPGVQAAAVAASGVTVALPGGDKLLVPVKPDGVAPGTPPSCP